MSWPVSAAMATRPRRRLLSVSVAQSTTLSRRGQTVKNRSHLEVSDSPWNRHRMAAAIDGLDSGGRIGPDPAKLHHHAVPQADRGRRITGRTLGSAR